MTGKVTGSLRRTVLFLAVGVGAVLGLPVLALPALLILALTDQVVEL